MAKSSPKSAALKESGSRFRVRSVFYFALALLFVLAISSYTPADNDILSGGVEAMPANYIGRLGAQVSRALFLCFGLATYVFAVLLILGAVRALLPGPANRRKFIAGSVMLLFGTVLLLALSPETFAGACAALGLGRADAPGTGIPGGTIGQFLTGPRAGDLLEGWLRRLLGTVGSMIAGWAFLTAGAIMIYLADFHQFVSGVLRSVPLPQTSDLLQKAAAALENATAKSDNETAPESEPETEPDPEPALETKPDPMLKAKPAPALETKPDPAEDAAPVPPPEPARNPETVPVPARPTGKVNRLEQLRAAMAGAVIPEPEPVPAAAPEFPAVPESDSAAEPAPELMPEPAPEPALPTAGTVEPETVPVPSARPTMPQKPATVPVPVPDTRITVNAEAATPAPLEKYTLPQVFQLSKGNESAGEDPEEIRDTKQKLQQTLDSFGVDGTVQGHISGPRVTRYEIKLNQGVPVSKVTRIEDNIKMDLSATSVRILAPIPGRPVVGVEIPNRKPEAVFMRQVMESPEWKDTHAEIPIVLGKDVAGKASVLDLAKAPHLLIAGSTGSGKSVCMNTLIMSLLFRFAPEDLKLILVDPKVVEMADYQTLPHLITPVINDSKKVPIALRWAVNEMEKRYRILAKAGVKKLHDYNHRPPAPSVLRDEDGIPLPETMPLLVVIVDELADLMMTDAKSEVETSIARIAQKGRAAGIHIVIATQRPSTNIITGVIKANLPTKIAFKVSSGIDSRVILDKMGAEMLLGRGDMLFIPPGCSDLERIQGAMVDDKDIKEIVAFVSKQRPQNFDHQVIAEEAAMDEADGEVPNYAPKAEYSGERMEDDDDDGGGHEIPADIRPIVQKYLQPGDNELMAQALEIILLEHKVSTSYLQRRLTIGYNTAAKLIDELEKRGVVSGPLPGGSKREILITDGIETAPDQH